MLNRRYRYAMFVRDLRTKPRIHYIVLSGLNFLFFRLNIDTPENDTCLREGGTYPHIHGQAAVQRNAVTLCIAFEGFLPDEAARNDAPYRPIQNFHPLTSTQS